MDTNECIFCKIVKGEIPSKKIYEDNDVLAFLDINPANPGHTLVVPKKHFENLLDADDAVLAKMIQVTKQIAKIMKEKLNTIGLNILQNNGKPAGQLVDHIHFHVIPRFSNDKILISYQPKKMEEKQLDEIVKKLKISASLTAKKKEPQKPEEFDFNF